ncbi:hypothetical protein CPB84DRAFT_1741733 [Gymnopilus junonius]|uniref:Zn(2)-C6 fungal-type domain-containing protein n=1 Tax=Gymnopilus junonius TaxID=109634 RepID=A0A9P5TVM0_GYMJU|nr:hypothetical protein CPB84DRAFT_1741733 [Gymnopilus junonius]
MDNSASQTTISREPKRVPMACTICRQKKLKCRPLPTSSDNQKRCQRCVEANLQCIFVPVSSGQPVSISSTQQHFQFRVDPGHYDQTYNNHAWGEQQDVFLNDLTSEFTDSREQRGPSMHQEYVDSPLPSSIGLSPQYQFPDGWSGYPSQPSQGIAASPEDPNAGPMQYQVHTVGHTWSGSPMQHQVYPPYDMNR